MRIDHIVEHQEMIPTLVGWVFQQWSHVLNDLTPDELAARYRQRTQYHTIPETFVAVEDHRPVGMACLIEQDMSTRQDLSPWLASVYVEPEFRNRRIGSQLVQTIMAEAQMIGVRKLYLYTPDKMHFYRRLGWRDLEETDYYGEHVTIMVYTACS